MSEKNLRKVCLVIDASIGRAAGGLDAQHPLGATCREFLMRVMGICHRMAFGPTMNVEWQKHASNFAVSWLTSMNNLGKLIRVDDNPSRELSQDISTACPDSNVIAIMQKDAHLLAAALATDGRIAGLDEAVRGHFARHLRVNRSVMDLVWVNPAVVEEKPIEWLKAGAPIEGSRRLRASGK